MSSEFAARKKRSLAQSTPAPEGDHRKRRRNRTTQSCLNCHTSKRMCDRKRPACARCTQLGLTGLCVYEVDDPNQRSDTQDESARLLKRVAELEGVIRELKNKPHPRWSQPGNSPGEEHDKWHSRAHTHSLTDRIPPLQIKSTMSSPSPSATSEPSPTHSPSTESGIYSSCAASYYSSSPSSTPSPSAMTPVDEYDSAMISVANASTPQDFDLASMFLSYSGLLGCENGGAYGDLSKDSLHDELDFAKSHSEQCGCLLESTNYNVVLELSLRLRTAADILSRSTDHRAGASCLLSQRISELDTLTTNTMGNIPTPVENMTLSHPLHGKIQTNITGNRLGLNSAYAPGISRAAVSTVDPQSLHSLRSWDIMNTVPDSSALSDDSFMTWEPRRM